MLPVLLRVVDAARLVYAPVGANLTRGHASRPAVRSPASRAYIRPATSRRTSQETAMTLMDQPCKDGVGQKDSPSSRVREDRPSLSVVIPVHPLSDAASTVERLPRLDGELILVDARPAQLDVAPEGAPQPGASGPSEPVPCHRAVVRAGFAAARGDCIVVLGGDLAIDPHDIERFVAALNAGCRSVHRAAA